MKSIVKISILTAIFAIVMFSCEEKDIINVESMTIAISPAPGAGNTVNLGSTLTATVTVLPENAKNKSVTFASSNPAVISVAASGGTLNTERAGQATITATANDGSGISASINLTVVMPAITVTVSGTFLYTGAPIEPSGANVTVKAGDVTLTEGRDYTLSYANNTEVGTATVTATGAGLYVGVVKTANFTITPFTGAGTSVDPYKIETPQQLARLAQLVNARTAPYANAGIYYELTADIDLNVAPYNSGTGWTPIGLSNYTNTFRGHFYGNFHKISGLYINNTSLASAGLFGYIDDGTVRNLGVESVTITGNQSVGGVVGYLRGGSIINCYATGTVSGGSSVGGIVGYVTNDGSVTICYATCAVSGQTNIGGIAGNVHLGGSLINCYATGNVSGNESIGGIAGHAFNGNLNITNCYATGVVNGTQNVGGVVGYFGSYSCMLAYCVALNPRITRIGSNSSFGRVLGYSYNSNVTIGNNVAWKGMIISGNTVTSSNGASMHGADITAAQAITKATYTDLDWKFDGNNDASPWKMGIGSYALPVFYWQTTAPTAMPTHLQ